MQIKKTRRANHTAFEQNRCLSQLDTPEAVYPLDNSMCAFNLTTKTDARVNTCMYVCRSREHASTMCKNIPEGRIDLVFVLIRESWTQGAM